MYLEESGRTGMRFVYALFTMILWAIMARGDVVAAASVDTKFLALAIMIAGALAGGDGK